MGGVGHAPPQRPQLAGSVATLTQRPPQKVRPAPQVERHTPAEHTEPAAHALPQRPQWALVLASGTSQPLVAAPSQSPKPALHEATVHAPDEQPAAALASEQAPPQRPQLDGVVLRLTSQPSVALALQSAKPAAQAMPHEPAAQVAVALVALHALPQRPQFATLVARAVSQPLEATPSQSP